VVIPWMESVNNNIMIILICEYYTKNVGYRASRLLRHNQIELMFLSEGRRLI
jgi:hypothetical protein